MRIVWDTPDTTVGGLSLVLDGPPSGFPSAALAYWRAGLGPWGGLGRVPPENASCVLRPFPTLDEVWTAWMWQASSGGMDQPQAWESMCDYVTQVREGLWPDRVPLPRAVQAVYQAIVDNRLTLRPPDRARFLEEAMRLCAHVSAGLVAGRRLPEEDLFAGSATFAGYTSMLEADRALYEEDRRRGTVLMATVPPDHAQAQRTLPLLVLERPVSTQFKFWARRDPSAPGGHGFPLLLTEVSGDLTVLSADPAAKINLGWLAALLTDSERKTRGTSSAEWYGGDHHGGTLVASPADGTRMPLASIVECLQPPLSLRPPRKWRPAALLGAGVAATVFVVARALMPGPAAVPAPSTLPPPSSASAAATVDTTGGKSGALLDLSGDARAKLAGFKQYAFLAGVCGYEEQPLQFPCTDARAMRDLLIEHYGYDREDVLFLVDRPLPGERVDGFPSTEGMKKALQAFSERNPAPPEASAFLFFYSGHGAERSGARKNWGLLQPAGFFDEAAPIDTHAGWPMDSILEDLERYVPSKHLMLILDNCHAGLASGSRGENERDARVRQLWNEGARVLIAAAAPNQRAWEDRAWNGGALTHFLVQGLTPSDGRLPADETGDDIVTHVELRDYVTRHVPDAVRQRKGKETVQTPLYFRWDADSRGQFLFVSRQFRRQ